MEFYTNGRKTCAILTDKTILISHGKKYTRIWQEDSLERVDELRETIQKADLNPITKKEFIEILNNQINRITV